MSVPGHGGKPKTPTRDSDPQYRTLAGLKTHPLWHQLTAKQQNFLIAYIETGDRRKAIEAVFEFTTEDAMELHASRLLGNYAIKHLLAAYYGYELTGEAIKKQEFLQLISDRLRNPHTNASQFVVLARIAHDLMGGAPTKGKSLTTGQSVNDLVQAIEKARKESQ